MRILTMLAAASALGAPAAAQTSVVFAMDGDEFTRDAAGGLLEAGEIHPDETAIVTPALGTNYSASVFHAMHAQWVYIGDADLDDRLVDSSSSGPGDDTDAVFVKRFPAAPEGTVGPREVFLSKEGDAGFDASFEDGDVFRYADQQVLEVFITEALLLAAIGQSTTGDIDLDAICQSGDGSLFFSFEFTEDVSGVSVEDGGIVYLAAADITYDASGNVTGVVGGAAVEVASEDDVNAWIAASGVKTSVGGDPTTSIDTTALEIDPNGGAWESPQVPGLFLPNLYFAWNGFSNDGAILSTAGGGSIAVVNGVPMGSTSATTGLEIGLLPDSTGLGGLAGLALIPQRDDPLTAENWPTSLITSSTILWTRTEASGCTPDGLVVFFVDFGPTGTGAVVPTYTIPGFGGTVYGIGSPIVLGNQVADGGGHASNEAFFPDSLVGGGQNFVFQVFDLGKFTFGEPAGLQFL